MQHMPEHQGLSDHLNTHICSAMLQATLQLIQQHMDMLGPSNDLCLGLPAHLQLVFC